MPRVVQRGPVPPEILALSAFDPPSYADLFVAVLPEPMDATPEQLARAAIEGAPAPGRFMAWRLLCGLRLSPPAPGVIGGWRIEARGPTWVRVATRSPLMSANMVFTLDDSRACFATFIRYDQPAAAITWGATVSRVHRRVASSFLAGGLNRLRRQQRASERS